MTYEWGQCLKPQPQQPQAFSHETLAGGRHFPSVANFSLRNGLRRDVKMTSARTEYGDFRGACGADVEADRRMYLSERLLSKPVLASRSRRFVCLLLEPSAPI